MRPQVEDLPDFIFFEGVKDLSSDVVGKLRRLVMRLNLVSGLDDRAGALNQIGIINSYLNNTDDSIRAYNRALELVFDDGVFSNYLRDLEKSGEYKDAIKEALKFLDNNPNNHKVFSVILEIMSKYFLYDEMLELMKYSTFMSNHEKYLDLFQEYKEQCDELKKLGIDLDYLNLLVSTAYVGIKHIQVGQIDIETTFTDIDQVSILFNVHDIGFTEIKVLNQVFDDSVSSLLERGIVNPNIYFDHLAKVVIGFRFTSSESKAVS